MSEEIVSLESSEMKILSEFAAPKTLHENAQTEYGADFYRIGTLRGFIIISTKNEMSEATLAIRRQQIETGTDRERQVVENWLRHDWWSVRLAFETSSCEAVIQRLEEVYDLKPFREFDLNKPEIRHGNDEIGVRLNSVMPHNAGKPIETLQIVNHRLLEVDGLDAGRMWQLITTPETGKRILEELRNLNSVIGEKSAG